MGDGVNHTLGMVAVQNGRMGLEVSLRQVEVERLVALEASIHLAVAQQGEREQLKWFPVICPFFDPNRMIAGGILVDGLL